MQKAMFLLESYRKGILPEVDGGFIFTLNAPDRDDNRRVLDPFRMEMISYIGVRSIYETSDGIHFNSAGRKTFALIEPTSYPQSHVEPTFRSAKATEHMPFRFKECTEWLTANRRFKILLPKIPISFADGFSVEFPGRGDVSLLYYAFDDDVSGVVLPYVERHLKNVVRKVVGLSLTDSERICREFVANVGRFQVSLDA